MRREVQKRAEKRKGGRQTVRATIRFDADVYDDASTVSAKKKVPIGQFVNDVVRKALEDSRKRAELLAAPVSPSVPPAPSTKRMAGPSSSGSRSRASTPPRSGRSKKVAAARLSLESST